ncbi:MAG TPA: dihydropteroate synthase [Verrucomicrobiales bacterium]|nr:dihydropteroate synthase [Verrucomicrobiales bacterium]
MIWKCRDRILDCGARVQIMGVLNVTPDSFSDGGRYFHVEAAVARGLEMVAEGADIIDIGGESTRPGAEPVDLDVELGRVIPVVQALRESTRCLLSVDTSKAAVARAAIEAGARAINDVTALRGDPQMAAAAADSGAGVVLMHMRGSPATMQREPRYSDVTEEVRAFLCERLAAATAAGIDPDCVVLDPGIGFGKTVDHNLELLRRLEVLAGIGRPVLIGVSRKSFLGRILGSERLEDRDWPTVGLTAYSAEKGASIVRVHDVRPNVEAARMMKAILTAGEP